MSPGLLLLPCAEEEEEKTLKRAPNEPTPHLPPPPPPLPWINVCIYFLRPFNETSSRNFFLFQSHKNEEKKNLTIFLCVWEQFASRWIWKTFFFLLNDWWVSRPSFFFPSFPSEKFVTPFGCYIYFSLVFDRSRCIHLRDSSHALSRIPLINK